MPQDKVRVAGSMHHGELQRIIDSLAYVENQEETPFFLAFLKWPRT
jgi:hypothetical protein